MGNTNPQRATYTGVDGIMDAFDVLSKDKPYYSVWLNNKDISFQWNDDDYDAGRQFLLDNLTAAEQAGHNAILTIKFHPQAVDGYITNKSPVIGSMHVRVCPFEQRNYGYPAQVAGNLPIPYEFQKTIEEIAKIPAALNESVKQLNDRITALEDQEDEEDQPDMIDKITGLLQNETVMGMIAGVIGKLFGGILPPAQQPAINGVKQPVTETAGGTPNECLSDQDYLIRLNQVLGKLATKVELVSDLEALYNYSVAEPGSFKMMLKLLRSAESEGQ